MRYIQTTILNAPKEHLWVYAQVEQMLNVGLKRQDYLINNYSVILILECIKIVQKKIATMYHRGEIMNSLVANQEE